ncbi:(2Fe-2S)-binding protein [Eoetvoesiella caeni]
MNHSENRTTTLVVNGVKHDIVIKPDDTLLSVLRDRCGLTGTKEGCGQGECGACTVLVGSRPVMACLTLVVRVSEEVTTIEGLAEEVADLREAFATRGAFQCGFCTSGQIVSASALLRSGALNKPKHGDREHYIRAQMSGNICRCTGYTAIVDAIMDVADHY